MVNQKKTAAAVAASLFTATAATAGNSLPLPPMGFNNWARYTTDIHESIFTDAADAMLKKGLLAAGYNRINLDDAWSEVDRIANGSMIWDAAKFPKGLPWLTAHLKAQGFIPGIYTDAGTASCGGYPGALGYEDIDLTDYANWGFQYLKIDQCNLEITETNYHTVYGNWHTLLNQPKHSLVFSNSAPATFAFLSQWSDWFKVLKWSSEYGQLARHSFDIVNYPDGDGWSSIMTNYLYQVSLARYQHPGFFNDPDFLIVDHPSLSLDEKKSHFALWATFSAPLIISADMSALTDDEVKYLTNKDIIAVDQDALVQQATLASADYSFDVLTKSLSNGDRLVTILNKDKTALDKTVSWAKLGLSTAALKGIKTLTVKDLWTGVKTSVAVSAGGVTAKSIPSHGTAIMRISLSKATASAVVPTGHIYNFLSSHCLSDDASGTVSWTSCYGNDNQVWNVRTDGRITSLLRPDTCLGEAAGKIITSAAACKTDTWKYNRTGNLINSVSSQCLTDNSDGTATSTICGDTLVAQIQSLPVGVTVN